LTTIAPLVFSYFDPAKDRYITLQSEAMPITVEGNAQANTGCWSCDRSSRGAESGWPAEATGHIASN
jgi:hypothetical protein